MISKFKPVLNKQLGPSNVMLTSLALYKWCILNVYNVFKIAHFIYLYDFLPFRFLIIRVFCLLYILKKFIFCILHCFYASFYTTILSLIINFEELALLIYFSRFFNLVWVDKVKMHFTKIKVEFCFSKERSMIFKYFSQLYISICRRLPIGKLFLRFF